LDADHVEAAKLLHAMHMQSLMQQSAREPKGSPQGAKSPDQKPRSASKFGPLRDRVIIESIPDDLPRVPLIIPDTAKEKPNEGQVIVPGKAAQAKPAAPPASLEIEADDLEISRTFRPNADKVRDPFEPGQTESVPPSGLKYDVASSDAALSQQRQQQQQDGIDPGIMMWVNDAPLAASMPVLPSIFPRFGHSKILPVFPAMGDPPDTIRLLYGTDRARKISPRGGIGYSWRRGNRLERGVCWVSIPPGNQHQVGVLEGPSWFKLQFKYKPKKHVTLHEIAPLDRDPWREHVSWLGAKLQTKQLLLFVHGYNVTFRAAARRTGQFVYDLGFSGVPMFYSWPSCGATLLYPFDEAAVQNAESHLQHFIEDAVESGGFESVFLVAHSMGNRVMAAALERAIRKSLDLGVRIRHLILAAPDIDAGYFRDTVAPNLLALGLKMTMYVSSRDRALAASRWFHGWPRVGDAKKGIVAIAGIDTIDASDVDTDFIGHSPFADRRELLNDIHYLIGGTVAGARYGLDRLEVNGNRYYKFKR
jgi:esterase/lipase superfamily enzyme/co-chaperonin GroES (HSP10)